MDDIQAKEMADEEMINQGFQDLLDAYLATKHRKKVEIITKAFNFAKQAHKGVVPVSHISCILLLLQRLYV